MGILQYKAMQDFTMSPRRENAIECVLAWLKTFEQNLVLTSQFEVTDPNENIAKSLIGYLENNGIIYDIETASFHLDNHKKIKFYPNRRVDIITSQFNNLFFQELQKEINLTWKLGLFTSTLILSRKLIENLVIEILRKKYPMSSGSANLNLYYYEAKGRFHNFSVLLDNLEDNRTDFGPDEKTISKFLTKVKHFKFNADAVAHSIIEFPEERDIYAFNIQELVSLLERILKNI
jgi:hypothetical protein